jgi:hypothetical protein
VLWDRFAWKIEIEGGVIDKRALEKGVRFSSLLS